MTVYQHLNKNYINGEWVEGSSARFLKNLNPYSGEEIVRFQLADTADVDFAYRSSEKARHEWAKVNAYKQREVFERAVVYIQEHTEEISEMMMEELGATRLKAQIEIGLVIDMLKESSTYPLRMEGKILPSSVDGKENRLYRKPAGVVGVISPFNFPFALSMKSVAPAIGAGNGVVLKPHEETPVTGGTLIAKIFEEAGLPKGVLNVIVTDIEEIGDAFVEHPVPSIISFTGSTAVGRHIGQKAVRHFKKPLLELGGNSAFIILDDADLDYAVEAAAFSRFTHQGQVCMCANRILVHRSLYQEFNRKFKEKVTSLKVGDPKAADTVIGPVMNERQAQRLKKVIDQAIEEGATPLVQGPIHGTLVHPTVFVDVLPSMCVAQEELFGPVVAVLPFDTDEEAIELANQTDYGLSGAVHTKSVDRGIQLAQQVETGMIHVNDITINDEPIVAFGGEKSSGIGRLNGEWGLAEFTTMKWISVNYSQRSFPY
ncbi:aldehyde dehydrogenase family protein [Bacillus xiapuensis]|uniref:aldehyde dehydrogenase family protein n=1 Tax=Bacillus xiapuensis TaxID=2014075 RepID=UPI000C240E6E|nr:aldehyde dehydrogenase family protein [Bacillus xiapuensis]